MNNEKVKEIKKALECWQESVMLSTDENYVSHKVYNREILDYINELESENERLILQYERVKTDSEMYCLELKDQIVELENKNYQLEQDLGQCENGYKLELHTARYQLHSANEDLKKAQDQIAELEKEIKETPSYARGYADGIKNTYEVVVPDKLKQFAEMLKEKFEHCVGDIYHADTIDERIDETLKESIGEDT